MKNARLAPGIFVGGMTPKSGNRFSDQIMRYFKSLARDADKFTQSAQAGLLTQNRSPLLLVAL
jgi:hypothetical protein